MLALFVTLFLSMAAQSGGQWPAFADALREYDVPLPSGVDGRQAITSFAVIDEDRQFAVAYYELQPDRSRPERLHVRRFDKARRTWASATFDGIGSVLAFERHGGLFFLQGHSSPSNGPLLVVAPDLRLRRTMSGWIVFALPDGRVVFHRGMRHFVPTQAAILAIYDPATNRDVSFYPAGADNDLGAETVPGTDLWMDRSIGEVTSTTKGRTIEFTVTEQRMRLTAQQHPDPAGAKETFRVICSMTGRRPVCRRQP